MDREEAKLAALRERMSDDQRRDMAEIIERELKRREGERRRDKTPPAAKSGGSRSSVHSSPIRGALDREQLRELYADIADTIRGARTRKQQERLTGLEQALKKQLSSLRRNGIRSRLSKFRGTLTPGRAALLSGIAALTIVKIILSVDPVNASIDRRKLSPPSNSVVLLAPAAPSAPPEATPAGPAAESPLPTRTADWSPAERELLLQLDQRRVELEKRRERLDAREAELKAQSDALNERIAELRTLTTRLSDTRKMMDARYAERLEQLATVYGSMQPKEAAPLIAKLDDPIALALLERLPAKRLGQILSLMPPDRAIELTRNLTDKEKVQ